MPALNEEDNILDAIDTTLSAFDKLNINGEIIVVNDGSTDNTPHKVNERIKDGRIKMISHSMPEGIGTSFWDGVKNASGNAVCLIPGDNEAIPFEILRYLRLLEHVDIVNPYVFDKTVRSKIRNFISTLYTLIINITFGTSLKYTNGTVIYRKSLLLSVKYRSKGFFYQTESLIKLLKTGYLYAEVPYSIGKRKFGKTKALSFLNLYRVLREYAKLVWDIYFSAEIKLNKGKFTDDSLSSKRYKEYQ